jgi:ATP-binding protein involved in chromosome partitioning
MNPRDARYRIMVMSGKGGVGKTTVAINLALGLALYGRHVGLLDADITGPNVPKMLKIEAEALQPQEDRTINPVFIQIGPGQGIEVVSMAFLIGRDTPVMWKGPVKMQMLRKFIEEISWGDLDYMIADLPPGTGDEPISIAQLLEPNGAIIVTTPYDIALMDAEKAIDLARAMDVPVLGVIENMSGFCCPHCGERIGFKVGGAGIAAERLGVPFLGRIEIDPRICEAGDTGKPFILNAGTPAAEAFDEMVRDIIEHFEGLEDDLPPEK